MKNIRGIEYKEADITGGIIAENKDGSIMVDYSYNEIFDSIEKENMKEIAAKLFGKDPSQIGHIRKADEMGLGSMDLSKLNINRIMI